MPTYDYKCPKCQKISSQFHKMNETFYLSCPDCAEVMSKCISAGLGLHFKGTGFYETDYKGK